MSLSRTLSLMLSALVALTAVWSAETDAAPRKHQNKVRHEPVIKPAVVKRVRNRAPESVRKSAARRPVERDVDSEGNPLIRSSAFVVQDLSTGKVLLEKNADLAQPIASITKLMTAMVVLDANLDMDEILTVTNDDVDRLKGTSSHLPVGTRLSREDMLRLALMASENRAASALGRSYPGGLSAFIEAMNRKALALGLHETRFYDSIGLNKNNVASARDLVTMTTAASRYTLIRNFTTTAEHSVKLNGRERSFHNTNALVRNSDWQINLSKTGYINESGKCLVMNAMLANRPTAIVLLDSWGRYTRVADANRIRRWVENATSPARLASLATPSRVN
jgi:serine-type D-Ala-D-Ala endopeptidase (penicillin-binding protein 7)